MQQICQKLQSFNAEYRQYCKDHTDRFKLWSDFDHFTLVNYDTKLTIPENTSYFVSPSLMRDYRVIVKLQWCENDQCNIYLLGYFDNDGKANLNDKVFVVIRFLLDFCSENIKTHNLMTFDQAITFMRKFQEIYYRRKTPKWNIGSNTTLNFLDLYLFMKQNIKDITIIYKFAQLWSVMLDNNGDNIDCFTAKDVIPFLIQKDNIIINKVLAISNVHKWLIEEKEKIFATCNYLDPLGKSFSIDYKNDYIYKEIVPNLLTNKPNDGYTIRIIDSSLSVTNQRIYLKTLINYIGQYHDLLDNGFSPDYLDRVTNNCVVLNTNICKIFEVKAFIIEHFKNETYSDYIEKIIEFAHLWYLVIGDNLNQDTLIEILRSI